MLVAVRDRGNGHMGFEKKLLGIPNTDKSTAIVTRSLKDAGN